MATEWNVENLRLSLFSNSVVQVTEADWHELTGQQEAETRQAVPGGRVFAGRYEGGQLSLAGASNRADVILGCAPTELTGEPRLPTIGSWKDTRDIFVELSKRCKPGERFQVTRLAFGAVLLSQADSRADAYGHLKSLLRSVSVNPEKMRDLIYRVNWPTQSKVVQNLIINRLTHWSALAFVIQQVSFDGQAGIIAPAAQTYAVRLELDLSTDATRKEPFSPDEVGSLYAECIELASENAANGETL